MDEIFKLANQLGMKKRVTSISFGQQQGPIAERAITDAIYSGSWVVLQNCHLAASWMSTLEKVISTIPKDAVHPKFRLWLTSNPTPHFPITILQQSIKITFEPPKGIRANLLGTFMKMDDAVYNSTSLTGFNAKLWKKLLFSLCFFHATAQERRKFGPLGWNHPYEFNESDLAISIRHLESFLAQPGSVQYSGLRYVIGECNYGGKVTDKWDRRTLNVILLDFFHPDIKKPKYSFSESGIYYAPEDSTLDVTLEYIKTLPMNDEPEVFGMHKNADMTHANYEMQVSIKRDSIGDHIVINFCRS
jgi:dynein heavy chain